MPLILGTNSIKDTGFNVANSCRFNDGSSDHMLKTASAGNRRTFTFSTWLKLSQLTTARYLFTSWSANNDAGFTYLSITDGDKIKFAGYGTTYLETTQLLRDPSSWYHLMLAVDTTSGTANNRCRIYLNGSEITSFGTRNNPSQNADLAYNQNSVDLVLGSNNYGGSKGNYYDGYMAEVILIDGQQLAPTLFGVTNSDGVWTPIPYTGTFGTNGFNLQFENAAALGTDSSPNGNTFTVNNLTSIDQSTDYPVVNFATMNPLNSVGTGTAFTLSEGNLKATSPDSGQGVTQNFGSSSTIGVTSGKWYLEAKATVGAGGYSRNAIGISGEVSTQARSNTQSGSNSVIYYDSENGNKSVNGSGSSYGASYATNDIIGIAIDLDSGTKTVTFYKNGSSQGAITIPTAVSSTTDGAYFIYQGDTSGNSGTTSTFEFNFGSPSFAISSSNADGNGYGNFEYAVPSGYYALNTANLAEFG